MHLNRPKLFKTKLCKYHQERRCKNGALCEYAHDALEVRPMPNLRKTKLCPRFVQGRCTAGGDCKYAHAEQELRATVDFYKTSLCSEWSLSGQCARGEVCRYAHGPHELRAPGGGSPAPGAIAAAAAKLAAPASSAPSTPAPDSLPVAALASPPALTPGALTGLTAHSSPSLRPPPARGSSSPMPLPLAQLTVGSEGASPLVTAPPPGYFVRNTGGSGSHASDMSLPAAPVALPSPWPAALAAPSWPPPPPPDAAPLVLPDTAWEETARPLSSAGSQQADGVHPHHWRQQPPPGDPPLPQALQRDADCELRLPPAQAAPRSGNSLVNGLPGPLPTPPPSAPPHIGLAPTGGVAPEPLAWAVHHGHSHPAAAGGRELEKASDQLLVSQELGDLQGESKICMDSANPRQALAVGPIGTSRSGVNNIRAIGGGGANCTGTGGGRDALSPWHVLPLTRLPVTPEKLLPDDPTTDEGDSASDGSGSMTHRSRPMSSFRTPPGLSLDGQRRVC